MRCKSVLLRLDEMRTGECVDAETREIERHLDVCKSCGHTAVAINDLAVALRSMRVVEHRADDDSSAASLSDLVDVIEADGRSVVVAFSPRGIRMIDPRGTAADAFATTYRARFGRELRAGSLPAAWRKEVVAALSGESPKRTDVDLSALPEFEQRALLTLAKIPRGEVRTYAWLAREAGNDRAIRAVGNALAHNPVAPLLPCHRVVPSSGGTGNYAFGREAKVALLRREGVDVEELTALAAKGVRYLGSATTHVYCYPTCRDARRIRESNRVPLRDEKDAREKGFRPCGHCRPIAAA